MRFAVKGIFCMETTFTDMLKDKNKFYEIRIINIEADTEYQAYQQALAIFSADEWEAKQPIEHILLQTQKFIGINRVRDLEIMEEYEVWYEYVATCPQILNLNTLV